MTQKIKLLTSLLLILGFSYTITAQESHPPHGKYQQFMTDAWGADVYNDIQNDKIFSRLYKDLYQNRIVYEKQTSTSRPLKKPLFLKDINLSENKTKTIVRDNTFNPLTFNPFNYQLPFFENGDQYIKVDNTDYVIIIRSKKSL